MEIADWLYAAALFFLFVQAVVWLLMWRRLWRLSADISCTMTQISTLVEELRVRKDAEGICTKNLNSASFDASFSA